MKPFSLAILNSIMLIAFAITSRAAYAAPTPCRDKIAAVVLDRLSHENPAAGGHTVTPVLLNDTFEDLSSSSDRDLQLWQIWEDSLDAGRPVPHSFAITRGEGSSACVLVKFYRNRN